MRLLDYFNECLHGGYNNTPDYISWKIKDRILYLQCSREKEDWLKNFDVRPRLERIRNELCVIPNGFNQAAKDLSEKLDFSQFDLIIGYSHGAAIGAILSGMTGIPAIVFGCPRFIYKPSFDIEKVFSNLKIYSNCDDVVFKVPPFYSYCGLLHTFARGEVETDSWLERISNHSPDLYRKNLAGY